MFKEIVSHIYNLFLLSIFLLTLLLSYYYLKYRVNSLLDYVIPTSAKKEDELLKKRNQEIREEYKKIQYKVSDDARKKFPVGNSLIGKEYNFPEDAIIKLNLNPAQSSDSYKIQAIKIQKGDSVKILGIDSNHYIVETKNSKAKGYCETDIIDCSIIDLQNIYREELLDKYLNGLEIKYDLSKNDIYKII